MEQTERTKTMKRNQIKPSDIVTGFQKALKKTGYITNEKNTNRVLLDQWHVDVYIAPTRTLTKDERSAVKTLMNAYLNLAAQRMMKELEGKIEVMISQ